MVSRLSPWEPANSEIDRTEARAVAGVKCSWELRPVNPAAGAALAAMQNKVGNRQMYFRQFQMLMGIVRPALGEFRRFQHAQVSGSRVTSVVGAASGNESLYAPFWRRVYPLCR